MLCRGTHLSNPNKGKWYKFNDTVIEEFEMNDASLEAECFGGAYKAKVYDHCKCVFAPGQTLVFVRNVENFQEHTYF